MWILPTRGRPDACRETIKALQAMPPVPMVQVIVDHDVNNYRNIEWPLHWYVHTSLEHLEMTKAVNLGVCLHEGAGFYGMIGDYARPKTPGWSERLEEAAGDWNVAYCRDNWMNGRRQDDKTRPHISGALCVGGKLVGALGWMFLPSTVHLCVDTVLEYIATETGGHRYLDDVVVEVDRPETTGRPRDANHGRMYKGVHYPRADKDAAFKWIAEEGPRVCARINELKAMEAQGAGTG